MSAGHLRRTTVCASPCEAGSSHPRVVLVLHMQQGAMWPKAEGGEQVQMPERPASSFAII